MDGFHVTPEAFAILTSAYNGFHVKPKAFAILIPAKNGFHVTPEVYAILIAAENGFHVKPEVFAILTAENEFFIKPEVFAFELVVGEKRPVLRLIITYNGKSIIVPCIISAGKPVLIIRWNEINWYNPLVSPTSYRASGVCVTYKGTTFALSI